MNSSLAVDETHELSATSSRRWLHRSRIAAYWVATMPVAYEMVAGGIWDVGRIKYVRVVIARLGYPAYLPVIIGIGKIPCALALLSKGFPRIKEWAYAGALFNYAGAAASHFAVGDRPKKWLVPLLFAASTLSSRALLPAARTRLPAGWRDPPGFMAWAFPVLTAGCLLVLALVSLPRGAPPR